MKIVVVGGGSAGLLTGLHYTHYTSPLKNIEVEVIHDPKMEPVPFGQGTLLDTPRLLWNALGSNWFVNKMKAVPKLGILYENWGKKKAEFFHPFPFAALALHFNTNELHNTIIDSGILNVREENIKNIDEIDADVIFDCRGKIDGEYDEIINPINSCLLATSDQRDHKQLWTRCVATPDGWTFIIPNADDTTSFGYLYNKDITDVNTAKENFGELFSQNFPDGIISKNVSFESCIAKEPSCCEENGRTIFLNGNRFAFIEPLEASSMAIHLNVARYAWDWVIDKVNTQSEYNARIRKKVLEVGLFLLYHYKHGSKYDTEFWEYAKNLAEFGVADTHFAPYSTDFHNIMHTMRTTSMKDIKIWSDAKLSFGTWPLYTFKNWHENVILN